MSKYIRYTGSDDWSALYIDNQLDTIGDHYLIDERISALLGVQDMDSDSFMLGQNQREGSAQTIDEIEQYDEAQAIITQEIQQLETQIEQKKQQLNNLRK